MPDFYEFFAGGGMARAGLGRGWTCRFANDFDHKKGRTYEENWGKGVFKTVDVGTLSVADLPGRADLAWASFPCQDLSLAGGGAGLKGVRSGTFWPFWKLMQSLVATGRGSKMIVLENVCGTLTSHNGKDFAAICAAIQESGYLTGAIVADAALFVPQSRPRLFVICVREDAEIPPQCISPKPVAPWHTRIKPAYDRLHPGAKHGWVWWNPPMPAKRTLTFADIIEDDPMDVEWYSSQETRRLIAKMSDINRAKLDEAKSLKRRLVGGIYRRTRENQSGERVQRAEVRFDISGCLRTPAGGSSRQIILMVDGNSVQARLISSRETARLMGLEDTYVLPENYNEAYHLTGDGVVVPVVRHLAEHIFEPVIGATEPGAIAAAPYAAGFSFSGD
ncbi:MAG TPA: DNA (cytosine-5-)-methyltransferase [Bryobacteraceae bacterium]